MNPEAKLAPRRRGRAVLGHPEIHQLEVAAVHNTQVRSESTMQEEGKMMHSSEIGKEREPGTCRSCAHLQGVPQKHAQGATTRPQATSIQSTGIIHGVLMQ